MNKQIIIGTLTAAMMALPAANAGGRHGGSFYDYAKVTHVEPIVRVVDVRTPREECWEEEVRHTGGHGHGRGSTGAMIVGGVIGGVVGNQFGRGRG
ncbi:MAG: glycine zipper 2TM domain-containing protein, partial [Gammaproteobacteria bacterium]